MNHRSLIVFFGLLAALPSLAGVTLELLPDQRVQAQWNSQQLLAPAKPELRRTGGGKQEWFDPNTRIYQQVEVPAAQAAGVLTIRNRQRQPVLLGAGKLTAETRDGAVLYRMDYPAADTNWTLRLVPVEDDGLDLYFAVETAPEFWLVDFDVALADLALPATAARDSGAISQWYRKAKTLDSLGPLSGDLSIAYPNGPNSFVPAAVLQDERLAVGVALLDAQREMSTDHSDLSIAPNPGGKTHKLRLRLGENPFFATAYRHRFARHFRLRVAAPKPLTADGRLTLVAAQDLWRDYRAELDKYVPALPQPARDLSKNNFILMNFFMSEDWIRSADNPNGWVLAYPGWKENPWEWREKITPAMNNDEVRRITGFGQENFGKPVKWIQAYADKCVREMREANAQAMITWQAALNPNGDDTSYIPESQLFHPELEEQLAVSGPVRDWDWVKLRLSVRDAQGQLLFEIPEALLRANNPEELIQMSQMARAFGAAQKLKLKAEDLREPGNKYLKAASRLGPRDRLTEHNVLVLEFPKPKAKLLGLKAGDKATLDVRALTDDRDLAKARLQADGEVLEVRRTAIDVWAKTLADAGQEFGFLVREDFTVGPPWQQWCQRFDWTADWQYKMLRQRFQWHRERFGEKCRWFYLDVFGNYTPSFVFAMLRNDFPDCFFFAEHPNDAALRTVAGWNWEGPMSEIERLVAPDGLVTVLPDRMLTGDPAKDRDVLARVWRNPHCLLVTHRGAPALLKMINGMALTGPEATKALNQEGGPRQ